MNEEDSFAVGDVLERVLSGAVRQGGDEPDTGVTSSTTTPSIDYGSDERSDATKENHTAENQHEEPGDDLQMRIAVNGLPQNGSTVVDDMINGEIDEESEYVVEKIVDKRVEPDSRVSYRVKWKNYTPNNNTWEPVDYLVDCDKVLQEFEIKSAQRLAENLSDNDEDNTDQPLAKKSKRERLHLKQYEVNDVMGITLVGKEKYFLVSLSNSTQKTFIRASLANKIIPHKVIDFYIKSMKWKTA